MRKFEDITTGYIFSFYELKEHLEIMNGGPMTNNQVETWIFENDYKNGGNCQEVKEG